MFAGLDSQMPDGTALFISENLLQRRPPGSGLEAVTPQPGRPNPDRRGKLGVTFANAQCAAPVCNPSRTAIFCELRSSTAGICENDQGATPAGLH